MRFRHAPFLLLAVASLALVAAAPLPAQTLTPTVATSGSAEVSSTVDAYERASDAVVAMTSGGQRTGSAIVVGTNLVLTSTHVVRADRANMAAIMTVNGGLVSFEEVSRDKRLGLVLLRASLDTKPVVWAPGRTLRSDDPVVALGIGSASRGLVQVAGAVRAPAAATGNDLVLTDIRIDPLVEGGPLVTPQGKIVGIIVAKGQGKLGGDLGWAVTSEAVREFVGGVERADRAEREAAAQKAALRWVKWAIIIAFIGIVSGFSWTFRRWYKAMEAREEAAEAAAAAAAEAEAAEAARSGGD